jgi:GNAT superfamily N-acetyltransferase
MTFNHTKTTMSRAGMLAIRALEPGETELVSAVYDRLGPRSRSLRFGGAKESLSELELTALADVGDRRHALVAFVAGDWAPAGIARYAIDGEDRTIAEAAIAVADEHHGRGVGTALMRALAADARAAGVTRFRATIAGENRRALTLLKKVATLDDLRFGGGQVEVLASIAAAPARLPRAA